IHCQWTDNQTSLQGLSGGRYNLNIDLCFSAIGTMGQSNYYQEPSNIELSKNEVECNRFLVWQWLRHCFHCLTASSRFSNCPFDKARYVVYTYERKTETVDTRRYV
ncbi:TPA_asm: hypothetical protein 4, partial [Varicolored abalone xenomavirus]